MTFKITVVIAGVIPSQLSSRSVAPRTPPSVTPERECTLKSPKAKNMLLTKMIKHDFHLTNLNIFLPN